MLIPGRHLRLRALATAAVIALGGAALPSVAHAQWFWDNGLSADDAARAAMARGYRVLARPMRNDDVYVADVVDRRGMHQRLIIAADSGRILQRIMLEDPRVVRRYADPSIPPGPIPPGRIPNETRQPGVLSRLFGNDDAAPSPPPAIESRPFVEPERPVRRARRPRVVEQAPETVHQTPVESAPLAPPSAPATILPKAVAPPPVVHRAPAQASLPPASETPPVTRSVPAPAVATPAPAPSDKPTRSISTNPLAIPGSREQDEKQQPHPSTAEATKPAPKAAAPATKPSVPVAPLE